MSLFINRSLIILYTDTQYNNNKIQFHFHIIKYVQYYNDEYSHSTENILLTDITLQSLPIIIY